MRLHQDASNIAKRCSKQSPPQPPYQGLKYQGLKYRVLNCQALNCDLTADTLKAETIGLVTMGRFAPEPIQIVLLKS
jgi:hypothetical protein